MNPSAMILTGVLMLRWLGELEMAEKIHSGVAEVIKAGQVRTYDLGGSNSSTEMAAAILAAAKK